MNDLTCPVCGSQLIADGEDACCEKCNAIYPLGVPEEERESE